MDNEFSFTLDDEGVDRTSFEYKRKVEAYLESEKFLLLRHTNPVTAQLVERELRDPRPTSTKDEVLEIVRRAGV